MTYVDLRPDEVRLVEVLVDGAWLLADLEAYRKRDGRWEGWVRFNKGVGQKHIDWIDQDRIRPIDPSSFVRPPSPDGAQ